MAIHGGRRGCHRLKLYLEQKVAHFGTLAQLILQRNIYSFTEYDIKSEQLQKSVANMQHAALTYLVVVKDAKQIHACKI